MHVADRMQLLADRAAAKDGLKYTLAWPRTAPSGPQLGTRPRPARTGGPSPFLVLGISFATGVAIAKWIDWRGHAHPKR